MGVRSAASVCDVVGPRSFLHAGPPVALDEITGPMRGAIIGTLVFEGEAQDPEAAAQIVDAGAVELTPCHDVGAVGAMAGIVSPSTPVVVAETESGDRTFAPLNEGLGQALRFGSHDEAVLRRLGWMRDVAGPLLDRTIAEIGGIDLVAMQAEGLRRGDECHNRNVASTANMIATLGPAIAAIDDPPQHRRDVLAYMAGNPHFFLSFSIAAAKAIADRAHRTADPGVVTAICANGVSMGVRVSGLGSRWFLTDAPIGKPKLFPGFELGDVCPAMGDSYITEVVGLGAFALASAPALTSFVGGMPSESLALVDELRRIVRGASTRFLVPFDDYRGTPLGIDVALVAKSGVAPVVNNGLAHRRPGMGQVGAGVTRLPSEPFVAANHALAAQGVVDSDRGSGAPAAER